MQENPSLKKKKALKCDDIFKTDGNVIYSGR